MNKFKKITAFLVTLFTCTLLTGIISACTKEPDGGGTTEPYYTVTVVLNDGSPVAGAAVTFETTEEQGEPASFTTDENGVASVDLPRGYYLVTVTQGIPDGYAMEQAEGYYTVNTGKSFTITLVPAAEGIACTVRIKAPADAGAAVVKGRAVTYSATADGSQQRLGTTDENGEAQISAPAAGFLFVTPPSGYNYDRNYTDTSPYKITDKTSAVNFEFLHATSLVFGKEMTEAETKSFANAIGGSSFTS